MLKKGNKLYSILTGSCPRCHEESMYLEKNPYKLSKIYKMKERCDHCNLKYKIEPSFFYGAMYVSYGVGIAFSVATFVIAKLLIETSLINTFISIIITLIVFMPVIMRVSRNIWINLFIKFNASASQKHS